TMVRPSRLWERRVLGALFPRQNRSGVGAARSSSTRAARLPRMEYQDAVCALNTLQTNASALEQVRRERGNPQLQLQAMKAFLQRSGLEVEDLDCLNIIHVTGTKGKGSTCAFTEQILRNYGFRTGFYSSPHLVQVRERIRINGQPISKELFTKYFWQVYGRLDETKDAHGGTMPAYFRFLTILAFHVFLQEKVDLAVIEVGIGGAYDCTNIIRKPWVCGVSSLGIDHTSILGDTMEKIAWQKGGIFKPGVPAFTVKQPEGPMAVLMERAREIGCPLSVCPDLEEYQVEAHPLHLGLAGQHQHSNASLALQLSQSWLQRRFYSDNKKLRCTLLGSDDLVSCDPHSGVKDTEWPGRTQTLFHGPITYYLDGAHTTRSMLACVRWFREAAAQQEHAPCYFDFAVFCPNITEAMASSTDQQNFNVTLEGVLTRCLDNQNSWKNLTGQEVEPSSGLLIPGSLPLVAGQRRTETLVFPCILSALRWITQGRDPVLDGPGQSSAPIPASVVAKAEPLREAAAIHVLITGSLHLVGGVLKHLEPSTAA
uniref:Folylpolyglutamate synthase n=1 Tax=Scleropages formosus TaxID=113540 RepID=A0A8C9S149_SCLFO